MILFSCKKQVGVVYNYFRYSSFLSEGICAHVSLLSDLNDNFWPCADAYVQSAALRIVEQLRARVLARACLQARCMRIFRQISGDVYVDRSNGVVLLGGHRRRAVRRALRRVGSAVTSALTGGSDCYCEQCRTADNSQRRGNRSCRRYNCRRPSTVESYHSNLWEFNIIIPSSGRHFTSFPLLISERTNSVHSLQTVPAQYFDSHKSLSPALPVSGNPVLLAARNGTRRAAISPLQ